MYSLRHLFGRQTRDETMERDCKNSHSMPSWFKCLYYRCRGMLNVVSLLLELYTGRRIYNINVSSSINKISTETDH